MVLLKSVLNFKISDNSTPSKVAVDASLVLAPILCMYGYFSCCLDYFMLLSLTSLIVNSSGVGATGLKETQLQQQQQQQRAMPAAAAEDKQMMRAQRTTKSDILPGSKRE